MIKNSELPTLLSELESLRAEIKKRDFDLLTLSTELENANERILDLEDTRKAMLCMLEDINECTIRIERAKKEWESTFDGISDPIFIHNEELNIIRANKAYAGAANLPFAEIIGKPYYRVFPEMEKPFNSCLEALTMKETKEDEISLSADKIFKARFHPISDAEGRYLYSVHIMEDVTEKRKAAAEKASLCEAIKEEAEVSVALLEMVEALNSCLDEIELIKNVINLAPHYLKFDRVGIFLYDKEINRFIFARGYGFNPFEEGILLSRTFKQGDFPLIDKVIKGETVIIENATKTDFITKELVDTFNIGSAAIAPISCMSRIIGGIYGDYKTIRPVEQKDVALLKGLANGLAISLQNSRLYKESVERLMELSGKVETIKTMAQIDRGILSTIDRKTVLKTAAALINRLIPCDRTAVILKEGDVCRVVSEWGKGELKDKTYCIKDTHVEIIETTRGSIFIPDISEDSIDCLYHKELHAVGIKSSLLVPLVSKGEVMGILDVGSADAGVLNPAHLSAIESIASQIAVSLENARLYEELEQLLINTITSFASAIDAKSPWTKGHSERVANYAIEIGKEMGLKGKDLERLRLSGLLHDIGKIGTYDILLDKPDKLTDEEFGLVKKHPAKGVEILKSIKQFNDILPVIMSHHEKIDGSGYPEGLKGDDIPLFARILCIADSFDSMTADRPYRPSPGREYAISELKRCSGTQFDTRMVEAFLKILGGLKEKERNFLAISV